MAFSFVQITDHHLLESEDRLVRGYSPSHAFRAVLRHIAAHRPDADFIVTTGDIVNQGTAAEYDLVRRILGLTGQSAAPGPLFATAEGLRDMPMYFLPGNHDPRAVFFPGLFPSDRWPDGSWPAAMNVSFTHKDVQFVCVDWGEGNKAAATPGMLPRLTDALKNGTPTIVLSHHHVTPVGLPRIDVMVAEELPLFEAAVRGKNVLGILAGHAHATYDASIAGIPVYGLRSTYFSFAEIEGEWSYVLRPPHYRVITVGEGMMTTEVVEVAI